MEVLTRAIESVAGVGPARAAMLRHGGIRCIADLIRHLPSRYESVQGGLTIDGAGHLIGPAHGAKAKIAVIGEVATARRRPGRKPRFEATLEDGTGTIRLVWFNAGWVAKQLHPGMSVRVSGEAKREGAYLQMINPLFEAVAMDDLPTGEPRDPDQPGDSADQTDSAAQTDPDDPTAAATTDDDNAGITLRPVYPAIGDLSSRAIAPMIDRVLDDAVAEIDDHLPQSLRDTHGLPELRACYIDLHRPEDDDRIAAARRRLAYDELLMLQLAVMLKRRHRCLTLQAPPLPRSDAIDRHIAARLPFTLTDDQRTVVGEISADLALTTPMNRLLQGDVGAGKTIVAIDAMLLAVAADAQAALMAPTELLAEQHFASISALLAGSQVTIDLFTGSLPAAERRAVLARIESGEADIVIGTHALLTESVAFRELALVIIDEQHRFGVHQRATLRTKGDDESKMVPHVLVMTATPIPRTLSLTVFGDLDVSTIHHLPPGRTPIETRTVSRGRSGEVYTWVADRVRGGAQVYVVVPVIDESASGLTDLTGLVEKLRTGPLSDARVEAVHGRLGRDDRDAVMGAFNAGDVDVLVATTVIEVGVDVPNASIMVIEHAERFGLAQLHQLRGRVGRGTAKSVCVLIADPTTDDGRARIDALVDTTDGFRIAERDLEIRGPGELFGARQSGIPPFLVASLPRDFELLRLARRDAIDWIKRSGQLDQPDEVLLRRRLLKVYGATLGLGDVG